jgi:AAHS family 4-hydroxybenzoate transporter-like MFS transporter
MCSVLVFTDGFDTQAMGFVAPALSAQLQLTRPELGPLLSAGLFGMMIGALTFGPLADRFGRKPIIVISVFLFGILTTAGEILVYRLLTGLGLGGAMPNAIALTGEYTPKRFRATGIMTMFVGFTLGGAAGGFVAAGLISRFGWQSVFVVGGVFPCVAAVIAMFFLPESIRFLVLKGGQEDRVARYLSRIAPKAEISPAVKFEVAEERPRGFVVKQLFTDGRAGVTLLLWVMFFMNLLDLYFLIGWLPTVMSDAGVAVQTAILIASLFQLGGVTGNLVLGRIIDRTMSFRVLGVLYLSSAFCVFLIGGAGGSIPLLIVSVFATGLTVLGGQSSSNALTSTYYPTAIRSTGLGWALGIGRVGSIVGPMLGGLLLTITSETRRVFWAAAIPPLIATAAAFLAASIVKKQRI